MTPSKLDLIYAEVQKLGAALENIFTWQLEQEKRVSKLEVRASIYGGLSGAIIAAAAYFLR
jgi:hypothetical protein